MFYTKNDLEYQKQNNKKNIIFLIVIAIVFIGVEALLISIYLPNALFIALTIALCFAFSAYLIISLYTIIENSKKLDFFLKAIDNHTIEECSFKEKRNQLTYLSFKCSEVVFTKENTDVIYYMPIEFLKRFELDKQYTLCIYKNIIVGAKNEE